MKRAYKTLTYTDRIKIETLLNAGKKVKEIADLLNYNRSTIYREIKRGQYSHRNSDYTEEVRYSSDLAEEKHIQVQKAKGKELKIGTNIKLANRLEQLVIKEKHSPAAAVVCALDDLEKRFKNNFSKVFKSITVDNGVEFSDFEGLERSVLYENKRTRVYYCHAYSSWERGSNENNNRLVRRHIPKGVDFDKVSKKEVKRIESWMNRYPREIFNFGCAEEEYEKNIMNLLQNA